MIKAPPAEQFDFNNFLFDYSNNGFYRFDGTQFLKNFELVDYKENLDLPDWEYTDERSLKYLTDIDKKSIISVKEKLQNNIFDKINADLLFYNFLYKAEDGAKLWHSDFEDIKNSELFDFHMGFANCYMNDVNSQTGGEILFHPKVDKPWTSELDNSELTIRTYVNKYDIIIFNHSGKFIHKVAPTTAKRLIIFYMIKFNSFNKGLR